LRIKRIQKRLLCARTVIISLQCHENACLQGHFHKRP